MEANLHDNKLKKQPACKHEPIKLLSIRTATNAQQQQQHAFVFYSQMCINQVFFRAQIIRQPSTTNFALHLSLLQLFWSFFFFCDFQAQTQKHK